MKKVFVAGATGFLGTNLIIELLRQNYLVKGLDTNLKNYKGPDHEHLQLIQGDALDLDAALLSDCDAVIHVIGETTPNLSFANYHRINVEVAIAVLHAAIKNKVKRFVFVSSANTLGYKDDYSLGSEEKPIRAPHNTCPYALSKLEAEERLLQYSDKIDIVIANPTFMIGSYDFKPTSGRIILNGLHRNIIFHPPGGKNFVHVGDVARGLVNCFELGKNGEKYLLAGENLSFSDFYLKLIAYLEKKPLLVKIPNWIMKILGWTGDLILRLGFRTGLSSLNMKIMSIENFYSNQKSISELKLRYHPIDQAIFDALKFFQSDEFRNR